VLRTAGIEVFLDQSELRGGDVWGEKIRREIHDCALFVPVISANTASRHEGYSGFSGILPISALI
jgi:TIR domain